MQTKMTVRELLDRLPDDCSLDDVLYHLDVVRKVEAGREDVEAGRVIPHEDAAAQLRRRWTIGAMAILLLPISLLTACGAPEAADRGADGDVTAASAWDLDDRAGGPLPESFGLGRAATEVEIAAVDIDIMPDGHGLPAGSGSAADGATLYAQQCAICHGANLEGTPLAAALMPAPGDTIFPDGEVTPVPKTIGNYWPYATTLFDYIRRAMPFDRPGSMTDEEVYAVTAYLLARNGLVAEDATLDATSLAAVRMPARDRFVPDDRLDADEVR